MPAIEIAEYRKEEEASGASQSTLAKWRQDWEDFFSWKKSPEAKAARRKAKKEMIKLGEITAQAKAEGKSVMFARTVPQEEGEKDASTISWELFQSGHEDVQTIYLSKPKHIKGSRLIAPFSQNNVAIVYSAKS